MDKKPKLGIALGGGGARGFSHLGVLKALRERRIEFDVVTGTSIGSLVGAVYSAGDLAGLEEAAINISLTDIPKLLSPAWSTKGFFSGKNALEFLSDFIEIELIEEFPGRFAAVSSDMAKNEIFVFDKGSVRDAIRASIALPVVFTPVYMEDKVLVDGGLLEPVPVKLARELGADIVVAVDLFGNVEPKTKDEVSKKTKESNSALSYLGELSSSIYQKFQGETSPHGIKNAIDVLEATLAISQYQLTKARMKEHPADIVIQPQISQMGLLDFHRGKPIVEVGYQTGEKAAEDILSYIEKISG